LTQCLGAPLSTWSSSSEYHTIRYLLSFNLLSRWLNRSRSSSTVGCAALCNDGRIFTGINVFHFSGGPCAENVALANATAAGVASARSPGIGDGARLTTIVAVTNDDRGVISPCGRCRQMLLDFYPDIRVIVRDGNERRVIGTGELLPFAFMPRVRAPDGKANLSVLPTA
jgi:cytidine deaminase